MEADDAERLNVAAAAAQRLKIDYVTAEVHRAFADAGIATILLKGPSIVRWLYEPGDARSYADSDLLVAPHQFALAGELLTTLGFEPEFVEESLPDWWREHGVGWSRAADQTEVDLHRTLAGLEAEPEHVWRTLSASADTLEVGGEQVRVLSIAARALHLALHAAQHGAAGRQAHEVELAIAHADDATWHAASDLARRLDGVAAFATGLRFAPSGTALADRLGLQDENSVRVTLRASGTVDGTLTLDRLARSSLRTRLSIVRHKLFPPPTYMRKWSPLARRGPLGLAGAYVWRPIWVLKQLPRARRELRAARTPR